MNAALAIPGVAVLANTVAVSAPGPIPGCANHIIPSVLPDNAAIPPGAIASAPGPIPGCTNGTIPGDLPDNAANPPGIAANAIAASTPGPVPGCANRTIPSALPDNAANLLAAIANAIAALPAAYCATLGAFQANASIPGFAAIAADTAGMAGPSSAAAAGPGAVDAFAIPANPRLRPLWGWGVGRR